MSVASSVTSSAAGRLDMFDVELRYTNNTIDVTGDTSPRELSVAQIIAIAAVAIAIVLFLWLFGGFAAKMFCYAKKELRVVNSFTNPLFNTSYLDTQP
jgi:type IV secretory pathway TrbD component